MATPEQDAEHTEAHQPEPNQAPARGETPGSPGQSADHRGLPPASGRRLPIGLVAAGVALLVVTVAVFKVVNPSLAVLPPVIREPAGTSAASASGPAEPTPDLAAATLQPTGSVTASPSRPPLSPPAAPPAPLSYEAESADSAGVRERPVDGASGGMVVGDLDRSGDHVTFVVTVPAAGRYTMTIYYISGSRESRVALVTVNSGKPASARFASTGDWDTVKSLVLPVDLAAGGNRIRFTRATQGAAPDLDRITVSR